MERKPENGKHVRCLELHGNQLDNDGLSNVVANVVANMPNLETFVWDLPQDMGHSVWNALRYK
jgi:hypothetical protein